MLLQHASASMGHLPIPLPVASSMASGMASSEEARRLVSPLMSDALPKLSVEGLCLTLGPRVILHEVSFDVHPGEIVGILGPNGSGKTSLMKCLMGLMRPDRCSLRLDGALMPFRARKLRSCMGVVFQESSVDDRLTTFENLMMGAALFGIRGQEARKRAEDLLVFMELETRCRDKVASLSGGTRRRLELARALIHRPSILFLDEPTTGLDLAVFERTWQRLLALRRWQGLTVLLSTHHAEEASRCDRLLVLDRGHRVAWDTPEALIHQVAGDVLVLTCKHPEALAAEIEKTFLLSPQVVGHQLVLECEQAHTWVPRLVEAFPGGRIQAVSLRRPSVADAFFHLTGHGLRREPEGGLAEML